MMRKKKKRKLTLNRRLGLITLSALIPLTMVISYLLYSMYMYSHSFDEVTKSVTYGNQYAREFKERVDYSMYLAIIRGEKSASLEEGEVTINGVQIVNPYKYIEELRQACKEMAEIATVRGNKSRPERLMNTLNSLEKRITEIDANMENKENYDVNLELLDENVRSLTSLIQEGIQEYVNAEAENFNVVKGEMLTRYSEMFRLCIAMVVVTAVLTTIMTILAFQSIAKPIQRLCEMSKKVAKGDFTVRTNVEAEDEIAVLTDNFNDMTEEIGHLMRGIKEEEDNLRVMETKLLQAQINPHFLYNTLDTIVWLAEQKQTEEVVSMVTLLSDFFRTTLSKGKDFITIEEEKQHVESYLKIQQFRYQDILDFEIDIECEIYQFTIPKLTLQPLVENALYHGIKNKRGKGIIRICGILKGEKIILKVVDNGKGMNEKELDDLRRYIAGIDKEKSGGFGLANVNQRIHYYYGEEYGIFFQSTANEGTEAAIIIPAKNIHTKS